MTRHSRSRKTRLTVAELQSRHDVEPAHTAHVTALALRLFDLAGPALGLGREHRRLLETAAQLHDVAFARHPARHAEAGARLLLRDGIAGLTGAERAVVAAAVLLHSVRYREKLDDPLVSESPDRDLVLRLAACLRIADGLDFEHIQNVTIAGVRPRGKTLTVTVRSHGRDRSLVQAARKADLWEEVTGAEVRFVAADALRNGGGSVITKGNEVPQALRRLMSVQYKLMRDAAEGFVRGDDPEALHDLRVALRRLRALLRLAGKPLRDEAAAGLERDLGKVSRALGEARDLEVWIRTWSSACKAAPGHAGCARYAARLSRLCGRKQAAARGIAGSPAFGRLCSRLSVFIRTRIEQGGDQSPAGPLPAFARQQLARAFRRMERRETVNLNHATDDLHAYRKAVRRARYIAEFFEPVLGPWGRKAARALSKMTTELGLIHDIDIGAALLAREFPACPERCRQRMADRRDTAVKQLKDCRRRCRQKRWFRKARRDPVRRRKANPPGATAIRIMDAWPAKRRPDGRTTNRLCEEIRRS